MSKSFNTLTIFNEMFDNVEEKINQYSNLGKDIDKDFDQLLQFAKTELDPEILQKVLNKYSTSYQKYKPSIPAPKDLDNYRSLLREAKLYEYLKKNISDNKYNIFLRFKGILQFSCHGIAPQSTNFNKFNNYDGWVHLNGHMITLSRAPHYNGVIIEEYDSGDFSNWIRDKVIPRWEKYFDNINIDLLVEFIEKITEYYNSCG